MGSSDSTTDSALLARSGWRPPAFGEVVAFFGGTAGHRGETRGALGGCLIRAQTPLVCAGCGRLIGAPNSPEGGAPHCWSCPVAVRLAAQLFAACYRSGWRDEAAVRFAGASDFPFGPEAAFWLAVRDADEPPEVIAHTPLLVPTYDGLAERDEVPGVCAPGGESLLAPGTALRGWLDNQSPGWVPVRSPLGRLTFQPEPDGEQPC